VGSEMCIRDRPIDEDLVVSEKDQSWSDFME